MRWYMYPRMKGFEASTGSWEEAQNITMPAGCHNLLNAAILLTIHTQRRCSCRQRAPGDSRSDLNVDNGGPPLWRLIKIAGCGQSLLVN